MRVEIVPWYNVYPCVYVFFYILMYDVTLEAPSRFLYVKRELFQCLHASVWREKDRKLENTLFLLKRDAEKRGNVK